ncbi:MAG: hypothetical protein H7098_09195 [Oligoflexus sp.]|nr:hypothetical protein [Pseudopedobacter sp.]
MIETTTPNLNFTSNNNLEDPEMITFSEVNINKFYDALKPSLNLLIKQPSEKVIVNILNFSRSISN